MKVHEYNEMMAYMLRPRQKFAIGGGVVEGEDLGTREGFADAKVNDPANNVKKGDDLGTGVEQKVETRLPSKPIRYTAKHGTNKEMADAGYRQNYFKLLKDAQDRKKELIEVMGEKLSGPQATQTYDNLVKENPIFEEFFQKVLTDPSHPNYNDFQKIIKKYNLTTEQPAEIFDALNKEIRVSETVRKKFKGYEKLKPLIGHNLKSNLLRNFNKKYLKDLGTLSLDDFQKKLGDFVGEKQLANFMSYRNVEYPEPLIRLTRKGQDIAAKKERSNKFFKALKDAGIEVSFVKDTVRGWRGKGEPPADWEKSDKNAKIRFKATDAQIKKFKAKPIFREGYGSGVESGRYGKQNIATSQSKKSEIYIKNNYSRDRAAIEKLTENLNRTFRSMGDNELRLFVKKNPILKNLVETVFNGATGEFDKINLKDLSNDELRNRLRMEQDHIRGRATVVFDKATKKVLDGLDIEYPKNLYIVPKSINISTKLKAENWIKDNPNETKKIKKIDKWFKDNKLSYWNSVTKKYGGAPPSGSAVDVAHLGLENELKNILLNKRTYIDNKGVERVIIDDGERLLANINELNKKYKKTGIGGRAGMALNIAGGLVLGLPIAYGAGKELIEGRNPFSMSAQAAETGEQTKEQNPSFIEEYPYLVGTTAAASPLLTKTGRKIYGGVLKGGLKAFGSVPSGLGFSASQFVDINPFSDEFGELQEDPNVGLAGADLLLPELGKRVAGSGTGILARAGRFALNPFQALEGLGRFGRAGRIAAMGARIPTLMTPVGLGLMGIEGVMMGMREQERINQMRETDPEAYQEFIADQEDMLRESAAYGGRMGFDEGGPSDPSRRKFMKIMGGLASLPIVGKFFRVAEQTPVVQNIFTEIKKLKNSQTIMPDWFPTFLDKFRREGVAENVFKKKKVEVSKAEYDKAIAEGKGKDYYTDVARTQEYKANNPDHMDYYKVEDTDQVIGTTYTNEKVPGVKVDDFDGEVSVNWENDYSQPVAIEYVKPGMEGPDLGRLDKYEAGFADKKLNPEGEFAAIDQEVYATDPDGGFEATPTVVDSLDNMMEGTTRVMEEYATGKPVRTLSKGEGKVIEAQIRAEQAAESAAEMADDFDDFE